MISDVDAMLAWVGFHKFHLRVALFALAMMLAAQTLRWAFIFAAPRILFSEFYIDYNVFTIRSLKYLISFPFLGVFGKAVDFFGRMRTAVFLILGALLFACLSLIPNPVVLVVCSSAVDAFFIPALQAMAVIYVYESIEPAHKGSAVLGMSLASTFMWLIIAPSMAVSKGATGRSLILSGIFMLFLPLFMAFHLNLDTLPSLVNRGFDEFVYDHLVSMRGHRRPPIPLKDFERDHEVEKEKPTRIKTHVLTHLLLNAFSIMEFTFLTTFIEGLAIGANGNYGTALLICGLCSCLGLIVAWRLWHVPRIARWLPAIIVWVGVVAVCVLLPAGEANRYFPVNAIPVGLPGAVTVGCVFICLGIEAGKAVSTFITLWVHPSDKRGFGMFLAVAASSLWQFKMTTLQVTQHTAPAFYQTEAAVLFIIASYITYILWQNKEWLSEALGVAPVPTKGVAMATRPGFHFL